MTTSHQPPSPPTAATAATPATCLIPSADGARLMVRFWPGQQPRGVLVIAHGLGEHGSCYDHVARALVAVPNLVDVVAFDFRGHGLSDGRRGVVRRYDDLIDDLRSVLAWVGRQRPERPRFVLGHSNGGLVALHLALEAEAAIAGLILSNPALRLATAVPPLKLKAGTFLRRWAPGVTLSAALPDSMMTRDLENLASRRDDRLRHSRISAPLFFGLIEGGLRLLARAGAITLPVLVILGGADRVIDPTASQALFQRLGSPDKTLKIYPETRHEPLNDLDRDQICTEIITWLSARLDPARSPFPAIPTSPSDAS